ncbi:MAG TPA: nuclear transport factor 2 family protein [Gemmatimonadaceae bacterium]|nr:nuclear transport factor 2 family protein [Gemmatimonadaceae bacterium]
MATQTVEQELVRLEKDYWQALRDKDVEAALELTDDGCILTGAQGVASIDREAFRGMMMDPSWSLEEYDISDIQARMLSDDVAIVAYKVREELTVEGKPVTLEAADSSTWVRRNGRWVCALHTEAITGDPFGRDRQPAARAD